MSCIKCNKKRDSVKLLSKNKGITDTGLCTKCFASAEKEHKKEQAILKSLLSVGVEKEQANMILFKRSKEKYYC